LAKQPTGQAAYQSFVAFDFGTSVSRIAYGRGEGSAFVTDLAGDARIPSVIAVSPEGGVLAGAAARDRQALYPEHTALSLKSLLTASPEAVAARGPFFPHKVGSDATTMMQIDIGGRLRPVIELSALFLVFLRRSAEVFLERPVDSGVLPVPVCFSPFDREVLRLAARMAGFQRVRLIDEPTAVALSWIAQGGRGRIATCSWGAGYLSASIIEARPDLIRVLATGGIPLGGDEIDLALARDFWGKIRGTGEPGPNEHHLARYLLSAAEAAKRDLTARGKAEMSLSIAGGKDAPRQTYGEEDLAGFLEPLQQQARSLIERLLAQAGLAAGEVEFLLLGGGMMRIPALKAELESQFGKESWEGIDPEDAVVLGALERARLLDHEKSDQLVLDALSAGLGLEGQTGAVTPILERGSPLPAGKREVFTTFLERQTEVAIQLFSGAGSDWHPLARVELRSIPPMKAGIPVLEVAFGVDEDGILDVTAQESTRSKALGVELRPVRGLPTSLVRETLEALPSTPTGDFEAGLRQELRERGRFLLDTLRELARRRPGIMPRDEKQLITKKSKELEEVLEGADLIEMRSCAQELEEAARPLMQRDIDASLQALLK